MNFEERISAFLDRALTPSDEAEFFHLLSVAPEKRDLLRSYVALHGLALADARATQVPPALDDKIFASIAASPFTTSPVASSWVRTGKIAGGLAILAVGFFLFGYFIHDSWHSHERYFASAGEKIPRSAAGTISVDKISSAHQSRDQQIQTRIVYRNVDRIVERPSVIVRIDTFEREPTIVHQIDTLFIPSIPPERDAARMFDERRTDPAAPLDPRLIERLEIATTRDHQQTYPYIDYDRLGSKRMQALLTVHAGYRIDEHHAVGISLGEKVFSEQFYASGGDSLLIYQQQPKYFYGGGFYRYTYPITTTVAPFIQLSAGSVRVGPVIGTLVGVRVTPIPHCAILAGASGSILLYKLNANVFTSQTLGLFYGVSYSF